MSGDSTIRRTKNGCWTWRAQLGRDGPALRARRWRAQKPGQLALRHRIDAENLHDRVHLFGHRDDTLTVYRATDLLLLPSAHVKGSVTFARSDEYRRACPRHANQRHRRAHCRKCDGAIRAHRSRCVHRCGRVDVERSRCPSATWRIGNWPTCATFFTFDRQLAQTLALYRRLAKLDALQGR